MQTKKKKIGKYLIKSKIAEGGMGAIYKAKHPTLKKDVILKKLTLRGNSAIVERFKREAQLMLEFSNDKIVQVYDHFRDGSSYYIVMEYIDGISLAKLIEKKRYLPNETALLIFREVCKALYYAHTKGVIHRDIKPDNVLISKAGEVKLTDFGIARSEDCDEECLTSAGMTLGTPTYMSPEQINDSSKVDKRSDIYSIGVMLYVMTTGKSPFPSNLVPQTINAIQKGKYIKPEKLNPQIFSVIKRIVKKSMHCKKKRRYDSVEKLIKILDRKLKKYNTDEAVNNSIMEYAYNKCTPSKKSKKKIVFFRILKLIFAAIILLLISAGTAFYLYTQGYHYEYLYSDQYGALKIKLNSNRDYKDPQKLYKDIVLYQLIDGKYKQVDSFKYKLKQSEEKKFNILETNKIFLKSAKYRIKVSFDNQLLQKDFYLYPRLIQKSNKKTSSFRVVDIYTKQISNLPVKLNYAIKDNNLDITKESKLYIKFRKRWVLWEDIKKFKNFDRIFTSGHTFLFKAVCLNYYQKYARVVVEPNQTLLNLQIELDAIPGYIYLKSEHQDYKLFINNSEYCINETENQTAEKYSIISNKFIKYAFSPGVYILKVEMGDVIKQKKINVTTAGKTRITIDVNKKNKTIEFIEE